MKKIICILLVSIFVGSFCFSGDIISPVPGEVYNPENFFKKCLFYEGIAILGSNNVADSYFYLVEDWLEIMLGNRPDIIEGLLSTSPKVRIGIMAPYPVEVTSDIPEHSPWPELDWARGLSATPAVPLSTIGAENLLDPPGPPYDNESLFPHEFSHTIHLIGLYYADPTFDGRLNTVYQGNKNKWQGTYAASNREEYWAEGAQCYFNCNDVGAPYHHDWVDTKDELEEYDPDLFELLDEVYGEQPGYCTASHSYENEMITNVEVGDIDKSSSWNTYSDFTSNYTTMSIGNNYNITVSVNYSWPNSKCGIWIDWNQDGDFADTNEEVYTYTGQGPYSTTITPLTGALDGFTRMRVRMFYDVTPSACGGLYSGEVEDYSIKMVDSQPTSYCSASHSYENEMITRVQVGSIDKSSSWATYSDFTSNYTTMSIGNNYNITVSVNYSWSNSKCGIWVDWNQDNDFDDPGEEVYTHYGVGPYSTTITPPSAASTGPTRMRVRLFYNVTPTPCGELYSGEVEDYTINVGN